MKVVNDFLTGTLEEFSEELKDVQNLGLGLPVEMLGRYDLKLKLLDKNDGDWFMEVDNLDVPRGYFRRMGYFKPIDLTLDRGNLNRLLNYDSINYLTKIEAEIMDLAGMSNTFTTYGVFREAVIKCIKQGHLVPFSYTTAKKWISIVSEGNPAGLLTSLQVIYILKDNEDKPETYLGPDKYQGLFTTGLMRENVLKKMTSADTFGSFKDFVGGL